MAMIYVRWIKSGKMTLDEVPVKWRAEVAAMLGEVVSADG